MTPPFVGVPADEVLEELGNQAVLPVPDHAVRRISADGYFQVVEAHLPCLVPDPRSQVGDFGARPLVDLPAHHITAHHKSGHPRHMPMTSPNQSGNICSG